MISKWIRKNIEEISASRALQYFGMLLAFTHVLTAYFWIKFDFSDSFICWPQAPHCEIWALPLRVAWLPCLAIYAGLAVVAAIFFYQKKISGAFWLLAGLSLIKAVLHLTDYRMMGNYHYMSHIINFTFLFVLNKKNSIRLFLVLFYIAAGAIKFNSDWLSGVAMTGVPIISGKLLEWACAYVIVLETVFSILLLSKNPRWRYLAIAQFVAFHLFSWHIVGYFYPMIMLSLLSAFFIFREDFNFPQSLTQCALFLGFIALQVYPMVFEPNSSLNGEGRILSLNMLDARALCETKFFIRFKNSFIEYRPEFQKHGVRIQCDPVLVVQRLAKVCEEQASNPGFLDIDVDHQVRRLSDSGTTVQMTFKNACTQPLKVSVLGHVEQ